MKNIALTEATIEMVARRFRMLGEPQRLRILQLLQSGPKSVNEVVEALAVSQSNVSRHLQALAEAGLIARKRSGNSIIYSIADPLVYKLCDLVCRSVTRQARRRLEQMAGVTTLPSRQHPLDKPERQKRLGDARRPESPGGAQWPSDTRAPVDSSLT
jgi:DNA-binding transcriptional ArsR family regulator